MDAKCYRQFSAFPSYDIKYCPPVRCHWHHRDMQTVYFDVRSLTHVPVLDILRQQSSLKSNKVRIELAEQCWWSRSQVFQTGDHRFMSRLALCLFHCVITGWSVSFALASYFGFHLLLRFRKRLASAVIKGSLEEYLMPWTSEQVGHTFCWGYVCPSLSKWLTGSPFNPSSGLNWHPFLNNISISRLY